MGSVEEEGGTLLTEKQSGLPRVSTMVGAEKKADILF
jgi:hypothetical protein